MNKSESSKPKQVKASPEAAPQQPAAKPSASPAPASVPANAPVHGKLAIIRVRGTIHVRKGINDTFEMLRLYRKNFCVVYDVTPSIMGMIQKIKDHVTWGNIDEDTYRQLVEKRGEKTKDKEGRDVLKGFFRLMPPRKGFGRKGIKASFANKGALGNRKEMINDLIKRML